jgi:hypothetical protein
MEFKKFIRDEVVPSFFISTTCITLLMAFMGTLALPQARFGYEVLFSPFVYGLASSSVVLINYSKKELTPRQALLRKILHVISLEIVIMSILYAVGSFTEVGIAAETGEFAFGLAAAMAVFILVIYAAVTYVMWLLDKRSCDAVNRALKRLQEIR